MKKFTKKSMISLILILTFLFSIVPFGAVTLKAYAYNGEIKELSLGTTYYWGDSISLSKTIRYYLNDKDDLKRLLKPGAFGDIYCLGEENVTYNSEGGYWQIISNPDNPMDGFYVYLGYNNSSADNKPTGIKYVSGTGDDDSNPILFQLVYDAAPVTTHKVTFNSNGGAGTMEDVTGLTGTYTLPANGFTAPSEKQFKGWSLTADGSIITTVEMTENRTIYAIWEDIPKSNKINTITFVGGNDFIAGNEVGTWTVPNGVNYELTSDGTIFVKDLTANKTLTASDTYISGHSYILVFTGVMPKTGFEYGNNDDLVFVADGVSIEYTSEPQVMTQGIGRINFTVAEAPQVTQTTYTVTFDLNGFNGTAPEPKTVNSGGLVTPPDEITSTTQDFLYWYKDDSNVPFEFEEEQITGDTTLHAKWKTKKYTVTFKDADINLFTKDIEHGESITRPTTDPTKEGYDFVDWYLDSTLTTKFDFSTSITANIIIYSKWNRLSFPFTDDFDSYEEGATISSGLTPYFVKYDGTGNANQLIISTEQMDGSIGKVLQLQGASSWASDIRYNFTPDDKQYIVFEADMKPVAGTSAGGMSFGSSSAGGYWTGSVCRLGFENNGFYYGKNDNSYRCDTDLTYSNGNWYSVKLILDRTNNLYYVSLNDSFINYEGYAADLATPEWLSLGAGNIGTNTIYYDNIRIYSTDTFTKPEQTYTVTFETYGGGDFEAQTIAKGGKVTKPTSSPSRGTDYEFFGWCIAEDMSIEFDFSVPVEKDMTLYAGYKKNAWEDNTVDESTATIISEVKATNTMTGEEKTEETFNENVSTTYSSNAASNEIAEKLNLAKTAAEDYISSNGYTEGEVTNTTSEDRVWDNRRYDSDNEAYSATEKAIIVTHLATGGYGKETTYKMEYSAEYESPKHLITFNPNGGEVTPTEKEYYEGVTLGELPTPTKRGYTFKGWYTDSFLELNYTSAFKDTYFNRNVLRLAPGSSIQNGLIRPGNTLVFDVTINNTVPIGADINDNDLISGTDFTIDGNRIYGTVQINSSHWNKWGTGIYGSYGFLDINCTAPVSDYTINDFKVFKNQASSEEYTSSTIMGSSDITLIAEWELAKNTISFNTDGGTEIEDQIVTTGNKVTKPANPTKENYGFAGWYEDSTLTTEFDFNTTIDVSMTIYSKWIPYHDIILDLSDGINVDDEIIDEEQEIVFELLLYKGLITYEEDPVKDCAYIYNKDHKLLFKLDEEGIITFGENITYKDNIEYIPTEEDLVMLASEGIYGNKFVLSFGEPFEYEVTYGQGQTHKVSSGKDAEFKANGEFSKFIKLLVDDKEVSESNYTKKSGSTIAILKSAFLDTLSEGTHKLTFVYTDGECSTTFNIAKTNNNPPAPDSGSTQTATQGITTTLLSSGPLTGDNIYFWIGLLVISIIGLVSTEIY